MAIMLSVITNLQFLEQSLIGRMCHHHLQNQPQLFLFELK